MEEMQMWPLLIEWNVAGATSGIGKEAARVLAKRGAHVILAVRNVKLGETVSAEILLESPTARVDVMHLDLNSLTSVREFVENFIAHKLPLNILL
jgi:NAD(P)-dependent dehydrogenase (short-subunit alcohol dehydrogenase family)